MFGFIAPRFHAIGTQPDGTIVFNFDIVIFRYNLNIYNQYLKNVKKAIVRMELLFFKF